MPVPGRHDHTVLRWDAPTADARADGTALELRSTGARAPLDTLVAGRDRLLITARHVPVMWAAGSAARWGMHVWRGTPPFVAPPWTADRCRRMRDAHTDHDGWWTAWAFAFAEALAAHAHPVTSGRWELRRAEVTTEWAARRRLDGLSVETIELDEELLANDPACFITWDIGSAWLLPARAIGRADEGRVKAAAKLAAEGTLPPLLLWWHSGLHAHVLLDGHVRLAACRAAGSPIRALTLTPAAVVPPTSADTEARTARAEAIEANVTDPVRRNRLLTELHRPLALRRNATRAHLLPGGIEVWRHGPDPGPDRAWLEATERWLTA